MPAMARESALQRTLLIGAPVCSRSGAPCWHYELIVADGGQMDTITHYRITSSSRHMVTGVVSSCRWLRSRLPGGSQLQLLYLQLFPLRCGRAAAAHHLPHHARCCANSDPDQWATVEGWPPERIRGPESKVGWKTWTPDYGLPITHKRPQRDSRRWQDRTPAIRSYVTPACESPEAALANPASSGQLVGDAARCARSRQGPRGYS